MTLPPSNPNERDASRILTEVIGGEVEWIERFPTGLAHVVYDARLADDRRFVVRLTRQEQALKFARTIYWYQLLTSVGIPLPEMFYDDVERSRHAVPAHVPALGESPGYAVGRLSLILCICRVGRLIRRETP